MSSNRGSRQGSGKEEKPFYQVGDRMTAAAIVSQARSSLRTLKTKRPETPLQSERTLLGDRSGSARTRDSRPPSVMRYVNSCKMQLRCITKILHILTVLILYLCIPMSIMT